MIRYYARGPGQWDGKVLSKPELDALEAQNLSVAVVFQHENNKAENFLDENKKLQDLMWARTHADHLQQPEGTPIYFGADFELRHWDSKTGKSDPGMTDQRIAAVRQYFEYMPRGTRQGWPQARRVRLRQHAARFCPTSRIISGCPRRRTTGTATRFFNSGKWHLYQNRVDLVRYYDNALPCPIDTNLANPQHAEFGQWRRSGTGRQGQRRT